MAYDRCTYSITGDVDCGTDHIQDTVDTHDQGDTFGRKSYGIQYHRQSHQTNAWHTGCTDRCQSGSYDYGCQVTHSKGNAVGLSDKYYCHTLHDGCSVHVNGCTQRDSKRRYLLRYTHFLTQRVDGHRDRRIGCCCGECKSHNRQKFLDKLEWIQSGENKQKDLIYYQTLDRQSQCYIAHIF